MTGGVLSEAEVAAIEHACRSLVMDSVHMVDTQNYEALCALFSEDAIFTRPTGEQVKGRDGILKAYQARPKGRVTRHVCGNVRIMVESSARAHATSYIVLYTASAEEVPDGHFGIKADARQLVGEFDDEFVCTGAGWRLAARRARFVLHT